MAARVPNLGVSDHTWVVAPSSWRTCTDESRGKQEARLVSTDGNVLSHSVCDALGLRTACRVGAQRAGDMYSIYMYVCSQRPWRSIIREI